MGRAAASQVEVDPPQWLDCRDRGHAWFDPKNEPALRRGVGVAIRVSACVRCPTRKTETIDLRYGTIGKRHYDYPPGYLVKGRHFTRTEARSIVVRAVLAAMRRR